MITCKKWSRFPQYFSTLIVSIAMLSVGLIVGWTSNTIDVLIAGQYNNIPINTRFLDLIASLPCLSGLIFSIPIGMFCDSFGRKTTILFITIPVVAGWLLIIFATSVDFILIGRFIIGIGSGTFYVLIPLYATEIAEKDIRAKLASSFQLFQTFGIFLACILGYVVHIKTFTIICIIVPIVFFLMFLFQVETPIYKVKKQQYEEARTILRYLRGESYDVDAEIKEIEIGLEAKKTETTFKDYLKRRSTKIALMVSLSLVFFQQASGTTVVLLYTVEIFFSAGSSLNPKEATIIIGALRLISALVSSSIIDSFPRKKLLMISSVFSGVGLLTLAVYYSLNDRGLVSEETLFTFGFMPVLGLSIFTVMTSIGLVPMPPIVAAELFPSEIRGTGISLVAAVTWFLLFFITSFYSNVKSAIGGDGMFYVFASVCFLSALFAIFVLPETKNKSLEQIQLDLNTQQKVENRR